MALTALSQHLGAWSPAVWLRARSEGVDNKSRAQNISSVAVVPSRPTSSPSQGSLAQTTRPGLIQPQYTPDQAARLPTQTLLLPGQRNQPLEVHHHRPDSLLLSCTESLYIFSLVHPVTAQVCLLLPLTQSLLQASFPVCSGWAKVRNNSLSSAQRPLSHMFSLQGR